MPYIFEKLWHLAIIWAIKKAFQCIQQGVRFLLANHTRLSPTSKNESYIQVIFSSDFRVNVGFCIWKDIHNTLENSVESMKTSPDQTNSNVCEAILFYDIYIQVIFFLQFQSQYWSLHLKGYCVNLDKDPLSISITWFQGGVDIVYKTR